MQLKKEPIIKGQNLTLDLTSWGRLGEAMASWHGFDVFVFGGIPGERVVAEVVRVHRKYAAARVIEVLEPSAHRVTPPCPYFGDCTGCQWQHLDYQSQLAAKRAKAIDALRRVGQFSQPPVAEVIPSARQYGYRNHARFTVGPAGALGFVNRETRRFVKVDHCRLMHDQVNLRLGELQGNCGETTQLSIRAGQETGDYLVQPSLLLAPASIETGQHSYLDSVAGRRFRVSSPSFFQVNIAQAAETVQVVRRCLDLTSSDVLLDAYTGVGAFAVLLAPHVKKVMAIEESSAAVADASENCAGTDNVEFILGKTEEVLHRLTEKPDAIVLDPPRSGCKPEALGALARLATPRVAYVSCDPETLARDLRVLCDAGYALRQVVPLDMFPQTHHLECVAALDYVGPSSLHLGHRDYADPAQNVVLASASPRRRELLQGLGLDFQIVPADVDEELLPGELAQESVRRLSLAKAQKVADGRDSGYVIGADSMVVLEGRALGKPEDSQEARRMLRELRGTTHQVATGLTVIDISSGRRLVDSCTSEVVLRQFTDEEIETSIATGTPLDKAGAYAVQDQEFRPAESWQGCYSNIVGLPLCRLLEMLRELGYRFSDEAVRSAQELCGPTCPSRPAPGAESQL